jgi:hypothetical protein
LSGFGLEVGCDGSETERLRAIRSGTHVD